VVVPAGQGPVTITGTNGPRTPIIATNPRRPTVLLGAKAADDRRGGHDGFDEDPSYSYRAALHQPLGQRCGAGPDNDSGRDRASGTRPVTAGSLEGAPALRPEVPVELVGICQPKAGAVGHDPVR
jgi:hypothetical protein